MNNILKGVLINDSSIVNHFGCKLVTDQIYMQCEKVGIHIVHSIKLNEDWREANNLKFINNANAVLVNGEGTFHSNNKRARILSKVAEYCASKEIPCYLINSVFQNNTIEIANHCRWFRKIYVRESQSKLELQNFGIDSEIVPDIIFAYRNLFFNNTSKNKNHILFSDSVLDQITLKLFNCYRKIDNSLFCTMRNSPENKVPKYRKNSIRSLLRKIINYLSSFCLQKENKCIKSSADKIYMKHQSEKLKYIYLIHNNKRDFLELINRSKLIVTGRFHMVCLALLAEVPFYAIPSNTHKIQAIIEDIGISKKIVINGRIKCNFFEEYNWTDKDLKKIHRFVIKSEKLISIMFNCIRDDISNMSR